MISNCSNNYGPYHFPEKLIPLMILNALEGKPLPVYGDGRTSATGSLSRTTRARCVPGAERGRLGETYNIGGRSERTNLQVVEAICDAVDELAPGAGSAPRDADQLRHRPARATTGATPSTEQDRDRARLASRRRLRDRPAEDRALVSRQPRLVAAIRAASIAASGWACTR